MDARIIELKNTVLEMIDNIITRIGTMCEDYKENGRMDDDRLINFFEDLQTLSEGIDVISEHFKGIDLSELQEKLDMLLKALEAYDKALFIDIIQFELDGLLHAWNEALQN